MFSCYGFFSFTDPLRLINQINEYFCTISLELDKKTAPLSYPQETCSTSLDLVEMVAHVKLWMKLKTLMGRNLQVSLI